MGRVGEKIQIWPRDPDHTHLGGILCINFVVLLPLKFCVRYEWSVVHGCRNK